MISNARKVCQENFLTENFPGKFVNGVGVVRVEKTLGSQKPYDVTLQLSLTVTKLEYCLL